MKKTGKITDVVLNNQWMNKEIKGEIKNTLRKMKVERQLTKIYWIQQKQLKRAVHSDEGIHLETRKVSKKCNSTPRGTRRKMNKIQS